MLTCRFRLSGRDRDGRLRGRRTAGPVVVDIAGVYPGPTRPPEDERADAQEKHEHDDSPASAVDPVRQEVGDATHERGRPAVSPATPWPSSRRPTTGRSRPCDRAPSPGSTP